ncbi:hypothetical protein [Microlunatus sp. GCM10028923]|uniref:hypothetical protein n=1 Tax=Microlunatus sp. GCM10028923 TaxID=3273400 RepID=UPI00360B9568
MPAALDDRVADDGETPIAVRGVGKDGREIVYGARPSATPPVADTSAEISGTRHFVDCSASAAGDGTEKAPFSDLDSVNALQLSAGDQVLLRRGVVCTGMLRPQGSGTREAPIVIDAYDAEADSMARIDARGEEQAVLLENVEHYAVRNLELTNFTDDSRDFAGGSVRRGIMISISDIGVGENYKITDLLIHTVRGEGKKDLGGSGGIQLEVQGDKKSTKFRDVEIAYNTIRDTNRSGINMSTTWTDRAEKGSASDNFYAWDPMHIHDNFVTDVGGDGIVLQHASGSIVERNTVDNTANTKGGKSMNRANAAVWSFNADNVTFRYNHVFGTIRARDNGDGQAFDADYGATGTLFEHNLSHDNQGGFLLLCGCTGLSTDTTVRYNVSLNDGRQVTVDWFQPSGVARTIFLSGQTDAEIYNNTFLLPSSRVDIAHPSGNYANNVVLANNVFLAQEDTEVEETATDSGRETIVWRNNVFGGSESGWPETDAGHRNLVVSKLKLTDGVGLDRLRLRHFAIESSGAPIAPAGVVDFVGTPVPSVTPPDVGAFQLSPIDQAQTTVRDGGFESGEGEWELSGKAQFTQTGPRSGAHALELARGAARTRVPVAINRTYRLLAAVRAGKNGDLPTVSVTLASGAFVVAAPAEGSVERETDGYVPVAATFRTSTNPGRVEIGIAGSGEVDDVALEPLDDSMIDGSFEALANTVWQEDNQATAPRTEDETTSGRLAAEVTPDQPAINRFTYVPSEVEYELAAWVRPNNDEEMTLTWTDGQETGYVASRLDEFWQRISVPLRSTAVPITVTCSGSGTCDDVTLVRAWDRSVPPVGPLRDIPVEPAPTSSANPSTTPTANPPSSPASPSASAEPSQTESSRPATPAAGSTPSPSTTPTPGRPSATASPTATAGQSEAERPSSELSTVTSAGSGPGDALPETGGPPPSSLLGGLALVIAGCVAITLALPRHRPSGRRSN